MPLTQAQIDALKAANNDVQKEITEAAAATDAERALIDALVADSGTPPDPIPPDPPDPADPAVIVIKTVTRPGAIVMGGIVYSADQNSNFCGFLDILGQAYCRWQSPIELAGQTAANPGGVGPIVTIQGINDFAWGVDWNPAVTLTARDGTVLTRTTTAKAADPHFTLTLDKTDIPEGWYLIGVSNPPASVNGVLDYLAYIRQGQIALPQDYMPVVVASYTQSKTYRHASTWVPARFDPVVVPLGPREFPPIPSIPVMYTPEAATAMQLFAYEMLVPYRQDDNNRPTQVPSGLLVNQTVQPYSASDYEKSWPRWPLLDGPRGHGTSTCATGIRATRNNETNKVLWTEPWRMCSMHGDGTIQTLFGTRHANPPPYCGYDGSRPMYPAPTGELIGDWSGVSGPPGFHECWDMAVDYRTTVTDPNAPPVHGLPPHPRDVHYYCTDTRNNRVLRVAFNGQDHKQPARGYDVAFRDGGHPWNCETVDNMLLVSWQLHDLVEAFDMDNNGASMWTVSIPRPEGLRVMDGIAYIGSIGTKTIVKMDLKTRALTKFADVSWDANSNFVNLAVSDGTFGPRGSVAYVTWSLNQYGMPVLLDPSGQRLAVGQRNIGWGEPKGMAMPGIYYLMRMDGDTPVTGSDGFSYPSAVEIYGGRLIWSTVQEGLHQLSAALPTDQPVPGAVYQGFQEWHDREFRLAYGDRGWDLYDGGRSLPWGVDPAIDAMLLNTGHKPAVMRRQFLHCR